MINKDALTFSPVFKEKKNSLSAYGVCKQTYLFGRKVTEKGKTTLNLAFSEEMFVLHNS